ncbi:MAG: ABC transporter permease [Leifsonia xyli]|nr:MAG: ABC transporter permease [Leifsonia xyli]
MSALTASESTAATPRAVARVWRIARLLTTNPWTVAGLPFMILGVIFVLTWIIWWLINVNLGADARADAGDAQYNGAASYIFVYMLVIAVQSVNLAFPLALGYGATRRAFSLGSTLAFVMLSAVYALVMTIGAWLEDLTDGWGLKGVFFRTFYFATDDGWLVQWWVYFCWFVFFFFTGTIFAAMYVRWKATGLTLSLVSLALLVVGAIAGLTLTSSWGTLWGTIGDLGVVGVASVLLIPAVAAAIVGGLVLQRATPRG